MAIVTMKIMPVSPDTDLEKIKIEATKKIEDYSSSLEVKDEIEPVAFGLKALKLTFVMDENKGSPDDLESDLAGIEGVNSVETVDVRRAVG